MVQCVVPYVGLHVGLQRHIREMGLVCYPQHGDQLPWSESLDKHLGGCMLFAGSPCVRP